MIRLQGRALVFKGEITAFLSLIFILMISVVGVLIGSASIQITKSQKRADTILALESTFAEYHTELLKRYDLFACLGSSDNALCNRLEYYGAANMTHKVIRQEFLTDNGGEPFYQQAVRYMKDWLGLKELSANTEYNFSPHSYLEEEEALISQEMEDILQQENIELPKENNPIEYVKNLKESSLLSILVSNPEELSNQYIELNELASKRSLQQGNYGAGVSSGTADKLFFVAYLTEHFSDVTKGETENALLYEQEYLLEGKASDRENLEAVCRKIISIRMIANYGYLLTDNTKQAEAEAMALILCSLLTVPEAAEVVKHALLLAWSYGESIVDMRALLKQKKVPAIKTAETWQLQLTNLIKLGSNEAVTDEVEISEGLTYQDYLNGLLLLENKETLCMRALDLMERNLHIKTDQCMTKVEIKSMKTLRWGIQDTFTTTFGYQ